MVLRSFGRTLLERFCCAPVRMRQGPPHSLGSLVLSLSCALEIMRPRPTRSFGIGFPGILPKLSFSSDPTLPLAWYWVLWFQPTPPPPRPEKIPKRTAGNGPGMSREWIGVAVSNSIKNVKKIGPTWGRAHGSPAAAATPPPEAEENP